MIKYSKFILSMDIIHYNNYNYLYIIVCVVCVCVCLNYVYVNILTEVYWKNFLVMKISARLFVGV